jgi:hypothetical protein
LTKEAGFISNLFPKCRDCAKRYPACQDTCPDAEEGRKKKLEIYAARKRGFEQYAADMAAHDRIVRRMKKNERKH